MIYPSRKNHICLKEWNASRVGLQINVHSGRQHAPTLFVMEGGYMVDEIGINAVNTLQGFDSLTR